MNSHFIHIKLEDMIAASFTANELFKALKKIPKTKRNSPIVITAINHPATKDQINHVPTIAITENMVLLIADNMTEMDRVIN